MKPIRELMVVLVVVVATFAAARMQRGAPMSASTKHAPFKSSPRGDAVVAQGDVSASETDPRTQYALFDALLEAQSHDDAAHYALLREEWVGRRYDWEVLFVDALCARPNACYVVPFEVGRVADVERIQGFLPQLEMTDEQHDALREACAAHETCVVRMEGLLSELVARSDAPVRMGLTEARFVSARPKSPHERWFR